MRKLISIYRKIRAKATINMSKHPILMTVLLLLVANLAVVCIAAGIAMALQPSAYDHYFGALAKAVEWLILPSSVLAITHTATAITAICVAVTGMVLFTGTVIAVTTNYLRGYITQKTEGRGSLPLSGHIVILGYNSQVLAILTDLMHDATDDTVLILSDKNKEYIRAELAGEIAALSDRPENSLNLIVRKGDPTSDAELEEINIKEARAVLVMDNDCTVVAEAEISTEDYYTVKLVMKLAKTSIPESCPIAVEAESYKTAEIIRYLAATLPGLKNKSIEAFSYNRKLGQFLALAIMYPPMTGVLHNLLSFSGCMFYPVEKTSLEDYLRQYRNSIPVFTFDKTFVLTDSVKRIKQKRESDYKTLRRVKPLKTERDEAPINLFIIGANQKMPYMLESLKNQQRKINIKSYATGEREAFLSDLENNTSSGENVALILSEDTLSPQNRDENVFLILIEINRRFGTEKRPFKIITEIAEAKNQESVEQFNIQNVIVSSRIISFFTTKLITDKGSDKFYEEIFSHSLTGADSKFALCIRFASELFDFSEGLTFSSYAALVMGVYHGSDLKMMPLGIIRDGITMFFCTDMDKKRTFTLRENDEFIYIKYH